MPKCLRIAASLAVLLIPTTLYAIDTAPAPTPKIDPADTIASLIDRHLAADWAARGIHPASVADDGEFVRRVYLDLIGRAPKAAETRDFLDDPNPDKRRLLVERLLTMPGYAGHMASVTRAAWLPQTLTNVQFAGAGFQFENWLRIKFRDNVPADEMVRQLLTVPFTVNAQNRQFRFVQANQNDLGRADARRLLPGQRGEGREPRRGRQPAVPRREARVCPVPRPPVRPLHEGPVLGVRGVLRGAGRPAGQPPRLRRPDSTAVGQEPHHHPEHRQDGGRAVLRRHRPELDRGPQPAAGTGRRG